MNLKQVIDAPNTLELLAGMTEHEKAVLAPELTTLQKLGTKGHKDNFKHSFQVLTNGVRIAKENNIPVTPGLKAALLLHDMVNQRPGHTMTVKPRSGTTSTSDPVSPIG